MQSSAQPRAPCVHVARAHPAWWPAQPKLAQAFRALCRPPGEAGSSSNMDAAHEWDLLKARSEPCLCSKLLSCLIMRSHVACVSQDAEGDQAPRRRRRRWSTLHYRSLPALPPAVTAATRSSLLALAPLSQYLDGLSEEELLAQIAELDPEAAAAARAAGSRAASSHEGTALGLEAASTSSAPPAELSETPSQLNEKLLKELERLTVQNEAMKAGKLGRECWVGSSIVRCAVC